MNFGSLFAGVGGFDLGLERAGMAVKWQVEIDGFCQQVLAEHWPGVKRYEDVREVGKHNLEPIDLLCGGFPCQGLSVAGKRRGLADERSGLFWDLVRIASELHPAWLVLENVPGLLSSQGGRDMGAVIGGLEDAGYSIAWRILDSQWFGVAQRRRRVFFVCHSDAGRAAAVLFEPESGEGHSAALRNAGTDVAYALDARTGGVSGKENQETLVAPLTSNPYGDHASRQSLLVVGPLQANSSAHGAGRQYCEAGHVVSHALNAHGGSHGRIDGESETFVAVPADESVQQQRSDDGGGDAGHTYRHAAGESRGEGDEQSARRVERGATGDRGRATGRPESDVSGVASAGGCNAVTCPPSDADRMRATSGLSGRLDESLPKGTDGRRYRALGNAVTVQVAECIGRRIMELESRCGNSR